MARRIVVHFPTDRDRGYYFRVFIWAESLYSEIEMPGFGVIRDLDRVRETVCIDVLRHRKVAEILKLIRKTLPKHFPEGEAVIEGPIALQD